MNSISQILTCVLYSLLVIFAPTNVSAEQTYETRLSKSSEKILLQLKSEIEMTVKQISKIEETAGNQLKGQFHSSGLEKREAAIFIGLVVDSKISNINEAYGVTVLSITPGSISEKIGLTVGDVILSINYQAISKNSHKKAIHELKQLKGGDQLVIEVNRTGKKKIFNMQVKSTYIPGYTLTLGH